MKKYAVLFLSVFALILLSVYYQPTSKNIKNHIKDFFAGIFFIDSVTEKELKDIYTLSSAGKDKIKILIVPGHDNTSWGAMYRGMKEADLNLDLARDIAELFEEDKNFNVLLARDMSGYHPVLSAYFNSQKISIEKFRVDHQQKMNALIQKELIDIRNDGVEHNVASSDLITKLYGINKWSNENNFDIVLHIHLNDYPRNYTYYPGNYSGFAIYVPEKQYSNADASAVLAKYVFKELDKYFPISDMPKESGGIIEDQQLIALGSNNTLDAAALLIEYGYIYESQFADPQIRALAFHELANQTYAGIKNFFENKKWGDKRNSPTISYQWSKDLKEGIKHSKDVFALQLALSIEGLYPPRGLSKNDCPISGNFGRCTNIAATDFQKKYGISPVSGFVGPLTRSKLNELYSK